MQAVLRTPLGSPERRRFWEHHNRAAVAAREQLPKEVQRLSSEVSELDGLKLLGAAHALDSMRRSSLPGDAAFGSDAMLELLAGVVATVPEERLIAKIDVPFDPQLLFTIDARLRRIANLESQVRLMEPLDNSRGEDSAVIGLLRLEHAFDRMSGFDAHLQRVADEVFGPIDALTRTEVGFSFIDALRFADLYNLQRMEHIDRAKKWLDDHYPPPPRPTAPKEQHLQWAAGHATAFAMLSAPPLELEIDEALAPMLGVSESSLRALISAMSTTIGQAEVTSIDSENPTRNHPILALSSGEWLWARPVDFIHGVFDWAFAVTAASTKLRRAFDKSRQRVAEQLPAKLLGEVFGDRTHANVTYPADESSTEIDVLVSLPAAAILVECKGGRVSPQGRRGAPLRVARHVNELIEHASAQNLRAAQAIAEGLPFATTAGARVDVPPNSRCIPIVVTFDRVDPFSALLGSPADGERRNRAWVVALPDLVMLTEVLTTPADFYAYASRRLKMLRDEEIVTWVEADALGAWCEDRLSSVERMDGIGAAGKQSLKMVAKTSSWMNDYYSWLALKRMGVDGKELEGWVEESPNRQAERRPQAEIPGIVREALDRLLALGNGLWATRVDQAFAVLPSDWRGFNRIVAAESRPITGAGRKARKRASHISSGALVGGHLPVRIAQIDSEVSDDDYLVLVPLSQPSSAG